MCGIIAVLRRSSDRAGPEVADLLGAVLAAQRDLETAARATELDAGGFARAAERLDAVDRALRGVPGVRALLASPAVMVELAARLDDIRAIADSVEADLDTGARRARVLETVNAAIGRVRDATWAIRRDRLRTAAAVRDLAGPHPSSAAIEGMTSVQVALSAIDRLEVRGRDSAGLQLLVTGHGLDLADPTIARLVAERGADELFESGSVRAPGAQLSFVYKAAAEIGELGDNTAALRTAIANDELLQLALADEGAHVAVLGHTRWASVGIISEANAHPLNHEETGRVGPYVAAVLNGDVDNHADLRALEGLDIRPEITTDAKVIPALVSRRLLDGMTDTEAFRSTVASFEGSVAIAASIADDPGRLHLALRGSGQALYIGLADDMYVVASEPYGVVEETARYVRMDGESLAAEDAPASSRGQVVILDGARAGELAGVTRVSYDGTEIAVTEADVATAEITTRDIDRGTAPHFLLKEIGEAPQSFRKTLRGKLTERAGRLDVSLGDDALPADVRARLRDGRVRRILAIGQGTAAVAGQSVAAALRRAIAVAPDAGARAIVVESLLATELSGFGLADDMSDTLVIAISQSGTTTDTNRTVDVVRGRGAAVIAIVNRRGSDLTDKSDGVLYTSDGRDVEMSVASTKAFYAQVAAGFVLADAVATELGVSDSEDRQALLAALRDLPVAMGEVLAQRDHIAGVAQRQVPARRSWAVVGNGVNRIAAHEIRIKLSELCYKSIACDSTEDKKHIDLSAEPMILVCAAGLTGSTADDVVKEIAIYRAHKAAPIAIATANDDRFATALELIPVPETHPAVAFVLAAMAGHVFGYEAALAIDASALPLRQARAAIEAATRTVSDPDAVMEQLRTELLVPAGAFFDGLRSAHYDGALEAGTAVRAAGVLRYATGIAPLDLYQTEFGKVGTPSTVIEDLTLALTKGIDELTRPVDAIKHQAKTVTVGISRSDETLLHADLVKQVLATGAARDSLSYRVLRTLVALDPAVAQVTGFTRYRVEGDVAGDAATIHVIDRGGIGSSLTSRTDADPVLRGTKHRVAFEREVTVARGRRDGRTVIIVPEVKGSQTTGLALLHVAFAEYLGAGAMRSVLQGYRGRYAALKDAVTETEPAFDDGRLERVPVIDLLSEPVYVLAEQWR